MNSKYGTVMGKGLPPQIEEHYSENSSIIQNEEYVSVKDINTKFDLILERLNNPPLPLDLQTF